MYHWVHLTEPDAIELENNEDEKLLENIFI